MSDINSGQGTDGGQRFEEGLARKAWEKPALQRLNAREAQNGMNQGNDGKGGGGSKTGTMSGAVIS